MDYEKIMKDLQDVLKVNKSFLEEHEREILAAYAGRGDAETTLKAQTVYEVADKMTRINHLIDSMSRPVVTEGLLGRDYNGDITLSGKVLPPMQEIEVYMPDDGGRRVWIRTYVSVGRHPYLVGLEKSAAIERVCARIRENS